MALEDGGVNNRLPLLVDLRFLDELLIASRLAMYTGASPLIALNVRRRILNIIRLCMGSQCNFLSTGVIHSKKKGF